MYSWPTLLSLVSRRSSAKVVSLLMAVSYPANFISGVFTGWLGKFYEVMPAWQFWCGSAVMAVSSSVIIWLFGGVLTRRMDRLGEEIAGPSAQGLQL